MNKLQEELLNILDCFIRVCDKYNLTWFLANGSVLGAEKYGGFIPWDDDVDVVMPRKDYEIFCQKAREELPEHLFLQNYKTQEEFPFFYSKLRDSNTTFIEKGVEHLDINHGIYLDIFPLDSYPDGKFQQKILKCKLKVLSWLQFCGFQNDMNWKKHILRFLGCHKKTKKTLLTMEKLVKQYQNTKNLCDYGDRQGKGCMPCEFYGDGRKIMFESLLVTVPQKTDEYLTYKYGKWREDLPIDQQKSHHLATVCDLKKSYREYLHKN